MPIHASDRKNIPLQEQTLEHGFHLYPTLSGVISWANRKKGAVKVHMLLDHDGYSPSST
jgi:hypothetical protein